MKEFQQFTLWAALFPTLAFSQTIHKVEKASSQLVIERDAEGFSECGVRIVMAEAFDSYSYADYYDFSIKAVFVQGSTAGMIEGGKFRLTDAQNKSGGKLPPLPRAPSPEKFSLAKSTEAKALIPLKTFPDPRGVGKLTAITYLAPAVSQILNVAQGSRMHLMLKYPGERARTVELSAPLSSEDTQALVSCMDDLTKRASADADKKKK